MKILMAFLLIAWSALFAQGVDTAVVLNKPLVIKQIGGLDIVKMEKVGAPAIASGAGYMVISASKTAVEVSKDLKVPASVAEELLKIAKTTPGQAILAGAALGAGTIFVINQFGVEGGDGFFVKYKYWLALAAFAFGAMAMAVYKTVKKA